MQIRAIAIYKGDDRRVVRFEPGRLNVLPGWSAKGKSSLLEIAEYCLGRTTPTYAGGLDVVSWFGLLADFDGTTAFFGRPAAAPEAASSTRAMFQQGLTDVPEANELSPNTDTGNLRKQLGHLLGIPEDDAAAGVSTVPRASAGQALLFCFQRQGEIANANQLFHRANEDGMPRAIRDSLPFFLGAADSDYLTDQQRLRDLRAARREIERELSQARADASQLSVRAVTLVHEAAAVGLLPEPPPIQLTESDALYLLRGVEEVHTAEVDRDPNAALQERRLRDELQELNLRLRRVQERRAALIALRQERTEFGDEVGVQRNRLLSLQLLPPADEADAGLCPVCESPVERADASTADLQRYAAELRSRLVGVQALEPERRRAVAALRNEQQQLRQRIRAVQASLTTLGTDEAQFARLQISERRAFVRGKVAQFLQSMLPTESVQLRLLEERYDQLDEEIQALADQLDPAGVAARLSWALGFINGWMSESAERLRVEYTQLRLDPSALTVIADRRREGPLPLDRIGSAANVVGLHVATHAALHRWFVEQDRPVPRFLFLDQPEQAFFPETSAPDDRDPRSGLLDDDWARVQRIYSFLHDLVIELDGRLQVIVVGHAKLDDDWFEDATVENWKRPEAGLMPAEWVLDADPGDPDDTSTS